MPFHRMSAYVVHDLRNVAAQLALVVSNVVRRKTNSVFVKDALPYRCQCHQTDESPAGTVAQGNPDGYESVQLVAVSRSSVPGCLHTRCPTSNIDAVGWRRRRVAGAGLIMPRKRLTRMA